MLPPIYRIELADDVKQFYDALDETVRGVVFHYLGLISRRAILPEIVHSYRQKTYKVTIPGIEVPGWPTGLRIFFRVERDIMTVTVIDLGDHRTCASYPGESIYPGER